MSFPVQNVESQYRYFARRLHEAVDGIGTDDTLLTRIIVDRAENDLPCIKEAYLEMYKETLEDAIRVIIINACVF